MFDRSHRPRVPDRDQAGSMGGRESLRRDRRFRPMVGTGPLEPRIAMSHGMIQLGVVQPGLNDAFAGTVKRPSTRDYEFQVATSTIVEANLSGLSSDAELLLLNAAKVPLTIVSNGKGDDLFNYTFSPGTYYARVVGHGRQKVHYKLAVTATAPATPVSTPSPRPTSSPTPTPTPSPTLPVMPGPGPSNPAPSDPFIPAQGNYSLTMTGTTYYTTDDDPAPSTTLTPVGSFQQNGTLALLPTIDGGGYAHEFSVTADPDSSGHSLFNFATFTGSPPNGQEVGVAFSEDDAAGTITAMAGFNSVPPLLDFVASIYLSTNSDDPGLLNGLNSLFNLTYVNASLNFSQGGTVVSGILVFGGPAYFGGGFALISAQIQGTLES